MADWVYRTYKFAVHNMRNDHSFWVYKKFPSAYLADRWAMRISFGKLNSHYLIAFMAGEEKVV